MNSRLKAVLQYTIIFLLTGFLVWFSLNGIEVEEGNKWDYLWHNWLLADKRWLFLMAVILLISHVLRALRWQMLFQPTPYHTSLSNSLLSLLIGYWVNTFIPRGGEVSRCYNLYKLEKIPIEVSVGTVLLERLIDVICLFTIVALAFIIESDKLLTFVGQLPMDFSHMGNLGLVGLALLAVGGLTIWLLLKNKKIKAFMTRMGKGVKEGLLSIVTLKQKGLFVFYSITIWLLYYTMTYTVIMAFPSTSHLHFGSVLSLFGLGSIAMAAPLPAGTGSYHVLVPEGLEFFYGVPKQEGVGFTFIYHGWQTFTMILFGAISLVITSIRIKKRTVH